VRVKHDATPGRRFFHGIYISEQTCYILV